MKYHLFFAFLLLSLAPSAQDNRIVLGTIDSIYSSVLQEERKIWIYRPGGEDSLYLPRHYPVLYLLDGDAHFASVSGLVDQLSRQNGNTVLPEMIIVGILNTDRTRDLTPTHSEHEYYADSIQLQHSGGGENFYRFITTELAPHIDSLLPTLPYRIFTGHSFGGLTVMNTLVHHPGFFSSYIAIDPSMWWHGKKLLGETAGEWEKNNFPQTRLYLGIANTMAPGMDTSSVQKDSSASTQHIRSILSLAHLLNQAPSNRLRWTYAYYGNDDHNSVPLVATYDGLRFLFSFFRFPHMDKMFDKSFPPDSAIQLLSRHYANVSAEMGFTIFPPERFVDEMGVYFMEGMQMERALAFLSLNAKNYPGSRHAHEMLGDAYAKAGKRENAIAQYVLSLSSGENASTRKKLNELIRQGK